MVTLGIVGSQDRFVALRTRQNEFYETGRDNGTAIDLLISIEVARLTLGRAASVAERGIALVDLAVAQGTLGERESGTSRLREAVATFRAALQLSPRKRSPITGTIQLNLGNVLRALGLRESNTTSLEQAVVALRSALKNLDQAKEPLSSIGAQINLGNVLLALGRRERDVGHVQEAVVVYKLALENLNNLNVRNDAKLKALIQHNLGSALTGLGERGDFARIEEAVATFREALKGRPREIVPLDWAVTQSALGGALTILGKQMIGTAEIEEGVAALRSALEERKRDRVPLQWADTKNDLGGALTILGRRQNNTILLAEAVAAFREALKERTRENTPLDWAMTQNNLGDVLATLGSRESGTISLEEAIAAFRAALKVFEEAKAGYYVEGTRQNLARAERLLAERRGARPG